MSEQTSSPKRIDHLIKGMRYWLDRAKIKLDAGCERHAAIAMVKAQENLSMLESEILRGNVPDAVVESEVCECCDGAGSISYNPNLNPNAFPATTSAVCMHCNGTGIVEQAKPQPNEKGQR